MKRRERGTGIWRVVVARGGGEGGDVGMRGVERKPKRIKLAPAPHKTEETTHKINDSDADDNNNQFLLILTVFSFICFCRFFFFFAKSGAQMVRE